MRSLAALLAKNRSRSFGQLEAKTVELSTPQLLIADDDRDFRESLSEIFRRRGFCTHLASDGREAIEIVRSRKDLHLAMLDVHMPRLSGLDALEQIRTVVHRSLPCIIMTAQLDESIKRRAEELEIRCLLSKPFTMRDITGTVESIMIQAYGWIL
jgi:CheY-like chemotaxis protein